LDVDRLARGVIEPKLQPLDVGELIRRVAEETDVGPRTLLVDAPDVLVIADGAKVERIVENLLVNAARHTGEDARIWIRIWVQDVGVVVCVEDDGPGVPDELKDAIFEPFRQGPPVDGSPSGTGIGLSLVASFAALHGGRAWVEDRAGGGASFRVFLPLGPSSANGNESGSTNGSAAAPSGHPATELEPSAG
jgi:signal transduction histidine kinase